MLPLYLSDFAAVTLEYAARYSHTHTHTHTHTHMHRSHRSHTHTHTHTHTRIHIHTHIHTHTRIHTHTHTRIHTLTTHLGRTKKAKWPAHTPSLRRPFTHSTHTSSPPPHIHTCLRHLICLRQRSAGLLRRSPHCLSFWEICMPYMEKPSAWIWLGLIGRGKERAKPLGIDNVDE